VVLLRRSPPPGWHRKARQFASERNLKRANAKYSTEISLQKHRNGFAEAFDHSLDNPETLVKLGAILGRIRLVSSDAVLTAAEECFERIVNLYAKPNRTIDQLATTLHSAEFEVLKDFSAACRVELQKYSAY